VSERKAKPGQELHALKTPLNQIIGYAELLEEECRGGTGSEKFVATLQKIQEAAWRLNSLLGGQEEEPAREVRSGESGLRESRSRPLEHLLVVDDNEANRDMLSRRLESRGYRVTLAESGKHALDLLENERFDLLLLDIMMPEMSGLTTLKKLRVKHPRVDLPVIMATAKDQSQDIVDALGLGASDYVTKPIDFPVLLARVETHLSIKRAHEEIQRLMIGLELRNDFIRRIFGRYLNDEVVSGLLEDSQGLKLGGETREVTILMCDLRGFSALEDSHPPEVLVKVLNNYLGAMVEVVARHQGTVDEFMGDAVLVVFGAPMARPDDARRALACAIEMQSALDSVNDWHLLEELPELQMGIGVNTGPVVVGNIGSHKRAKYGIVGNHVNLTARIEACALGGQVLVSESTLASAGAHVEVGNRLSLKAKGFEGVVSAYELRGLGGDYNLTLPEYTEAIRPLPKEVPVHYGLASDGGGEGSLNLGALLGLAPGAGQLRLETPLEPLTILVIRFLSQTGRDIPGEIYARIVEPGPGPDLVARIRFGAVPRAIRKYLEESLL
jgi:class 3 adenylate cyclase/ActR/RegA family two-component response regulator